ncbi:hypothetical protein [Thiothrix nivea]|uniref:Uncharacterized protein n=1 Tax=Thiothrix nivea (strain ATCC 35100 / DSM 5205 / JP2) TaxID=870187 RepID=A0A656H8G4_THINJ|nr:hypothetical protein [Thiothrix nivea]EIJ32831.1 hypothetical protein Thini_0165 [Thiothrix nivea DSM 5205]
MITTEQEKQVSGTMELLSAYIAKPPWEEWMVEVFSDAIAYAAEMLELSGDEVLDYLEEEPQGQMAHSHVFEHFVTTETNEDGESVLQEFMRARVQQEEKSFACQYLEALSQSRLGLWEVVGKTGQSVDVRQLGSAEPAVRVSLDAGKIPANICIASRVLDLPGDEHVFSFGMLPIERSEAEDIIAYLEQVRGEMLEAAQGEDGQAYDAEDIEAAIEEELGDLMFQETLTAWVGQGFET